MVNNIIVSYIVWEIAVVDFGSPCEGTETVQVHSDMPMGSHLEMKEFTPSENMLTGSGYV